MPAQASSDLLCMAHTHGSGGRFQKQVRIWVLSVSPLRAWDSVPSSSPASAVVARSNNVHTCFGKQPFPARTGQVLKFTALIQ